MGKILVEIESYSYPDFETFSKGGRVNLGDYELSHGILSLEIALGKFTGEHVFYTIGPGIPFELRQGLFVNKDNYIEAIRAIETSRRARILKVLSDVKADYTVISEK